MTESVVFRAFGTRFQMSDYHLIPSFAQRWGRLFGTVVVGELDDPATYERVHSARAALVATTHDDYVNTHATFTVRGVALKVPIVALADSADSVWHAPSNPIQAL
jgi:hypothetical protein